ncbi:MAG: CDP-alcohol phosphatidyltransferase family protein [Pseudomonadota bacterium]
MKARHLPNLISILRILLVIPITVLLAQGEYGQVLLLFALAGISDGVDGYLARRFGWRSRLGALLDPLGDKVLLVGVYLVLGWQGLLPWPVVALVMLRDGVIVGGALAYRRLCGELEMAPTRISKFNTAAQIVLGLVVVVQAAGYLPAGGGLLEALIYLVVLTTLWSGGDYVWQWGWRAHRCGKREEI